jgi:hypothetical protein
MTESPNPYALQRTVPGGGGCPAIHARFRPDRSLSWKRSADLSQVDESKRAAPKVNARTC